MTHFLLRAGALSCALLASTALTAPAAAQSSPRLVDENGVDLVRGGFVATETDLHIGPASGGLRLERVVTRDLARIGHNWNIGFTIDTGLSLATIQIGSLKKTFRYENWTWTDPEQTGETLQTGAVEGGYTALFTDRNGTRYFFTSVPNSEPNFERHNARRSSTPTAMK